MLADGLKLQGVVGMSISYFDVVSVIYFNFEHISSPDTVYSLLGKEHLKDVTSDEDQDPRFPIPFYAMVFHFKPKAGYLGILETDFSLSDRLLNCSVLLHFGAIENQKKAQEFYENELLPYVTSMVLPAKPILNPTISGYTFHPKNLEVTARWVTNMPSVCTHLTLLDKCNYPS